MDYTVDDSREGPDATICATIVNGILETSIANIIVDITPGTNACPGEMSLVTLRFYSRLSKR